MLRDEKRVEPAGPRELKEPDLRQVLGGTGTPGRPIDGYGVDADPQNWCLSRK